MSSRPLSGLATLAAAVVVAPLGLAGAAHAAGETPAPIQRSWSHDGMFGTYDRAAAQRGFQIYREVCSGCHGVEYLAFRNLTELGFDDDAVSAIAAEYDIIDGPDDDGEMFDRPGKASDHMPSPYANEQAARASNGGALPPDLSLITKARADGSNYLYSLMVGYPEEPPAEALEEAPEGMYYNEYFGGHWIAMPGPLMDDLIEYSDGSAPTVDQMAADVTVFLSWLAEPTLEARKQTGLGVLLFLIPLTLLLYACKRKVWADVH
jgi:ubiquinol-cytochrome c reductase cytochrome c1 subunit